MGSSYFVNVTADTTLVTTAETVIATLSGVTMQRAGQAVVLEGQCTINPGTGTTAYVFRVREDSLTGNVVDEQENATLEGAVSSSEDHTIRVTHSPAGELSGKTYVLTVAQTGATANGFCNHASLRADLVP